MSKTTEKRETPTQRLARELHEARVEARENSERVRDLLRYLALPKFHQDTTVQVGDVRMRLEGYVHPDCCHVVTVDEADKTNSFWYGPCELCGQAMQKQYNDKGAPVWVVA